MKYKVYGFTLYDTDRECVIYGKEFYSQSEQKEAAKEAITALIDSEQVFSYYFYERYSKY